MKTLCAFFWQSSTNLSMGSPGCEHAGFDSHLPHYISHSHTDTRTAWLEEGEDVKPPRSLLGLPELSWPGAYLPCYDRLAMEENPWVLKMTEAPAPAAVPPPRTPEMSPVKPSQAQDPSSEMEGQAEERCLEQVQTMVVGEVLKDVDTACKLLNIAPGSYKNPSMSGCQIKKVENPGANSVGRSLSQKTSPSKAIICLFALTSTST